jgi:hypothetical protein
MNRARSRIILGLLVVAASAIAPGGAAQPPGTCPTGAILPQAVDLPTQCLLEKNIGQCMTCCMEAVDVPAYVCAHFCRNPPPPPPGAEPQP